MADKGTQTSRQLHVGGSTEARRAAEVERLMREFNDSLVGFLRGRLGSHEDAREVAQEAYVRLLSLDDSLVVSYQRALLFRIARNLATDRLRRRAYMETPDNERVDTRSAPGADPERSVRAGRVIQALPGVLAELPWKRAEAFRLVRIEQRSLDEVAKHLGVTARMVRIHVAKALAHCQKRFDELTDEQG